MNGQHVLHTKRRSLHFDVGANGATRAAGLFHGTTQFPRIKKLALVRALDRQVHAEVSLLHGERVASSMLNLRKRQANG